MPEPGASSPGRLDRSGGCRTATTSCGPPRPRLAAPAAGGGFCALSAASAVKMAALMPASNLGYIGGSYTAAASVAGLIASLFLDRFDRRKALAVAMLGLVLGTAAGGLATGLGTLMLARVVAGMFGGPATSIAFSIIA